MSDLPEFDKEFIEKIKAAKMTFQSPFSDDIRLSCIQNEREIFYLSGQCLAAALNKCHDLLDAERAKSAKLLEEIQCLRSVLSEWDQDKSCYLQMNRADAFMFERLNS